MAAGLFYWVDVFMRFRMGFCVVYNLKRELIMDGGLIAHFYIRHNTFFTDFVSALPSIAEVTSLCRCQACTQFLTHMHAAWQGVGGMLTTRVSFLGCLCFICMVHDEA